MEKTESQLELITKYFTDFSPGQLKQLAALDVLYRDWNNKINVISRKDIDSLYEKHILHSLSIAVAFEFKKGSEIIDIGTGGGFPGIPLAIFFPEVNFHLVDSIGKKIKVVEAVAAEIGLTNVTAQHIRAEEIRKRKFDFVVSRAVAPLKKLWSWSKPLLRKVNSGQLADDSSQINKSKNKIAVNTNGLICLKGGDLAREISESGTRPRMTEIFDIFAENYFHEKFMVFVPYITSEKTVGSG
jgi:16S rRNA (guanine527-N7)-methyltransferase